MLGKESFRASTLLAIWLEFLARSLVECAASSAGSSLMDARAQATPPKTSIYDSPPKRENPAMTSDQRLRCKKN
jgi:hypothetical protein